MAFEKKPSSNTDRGKVRSAEELETYGVWVKSGPQDMAADFGDDAVPFDHPGFDLGFGGMGTPGTGGAAPDIAFDSFDDGSFVADGFANDNFAPDPFENDSFAQGNFPPGGMESVHQDEVSAQLLLRIAGELSSIRADLDTLKQKFSEIHSESGSDESEPSEGNEAWGTGFFTGEDDGKITLTDNEMDNILASSGLQDERHGFVFDEDSDFANLRDADEAALKELSRKNDAASADTLVDEDEIEGESIDFGMDLDDSSLLGNMDEGDEADIQDRLAEMENDSIFDTDLDFINEEAVGVSGLDIEENDICEVFADDLPSPDALEDMDELRELRIHGANPLTPPPENSSYLEEENSSVGLDAGDEDIPNGEDTENTFDASVDENVFGVFGAEDQGVFDVEAQSDDGMALLNEVPYAEELSLIGEMPLLDDEGLSFDDMPSMDMDNEEFKIGDEVFLSDPLSQDDELSLDDSSIDGELSIDDDDLSLDSELPVGDLSPIDGMFLDDSELSIDEEISIGNDDLSMDEEISLDSGLSSEGEISFPSWLLSPESTEEADSSSAMDDVPVLDVTIDEAVSLEDEPLLDGEISGYEVVTSEFSVETTEVIDELTEHSPEPSPDELMLDEPILDDDISLDLDGFDDNFEINDLDSEDSNIIRVIPEGFKTGAEETLISFDDDLEAITEEDEEEEAPSPPPKEKNEGKPKTRAEKTDAVDANSDISPNLKKDLKNVLSYMDQLLESLPEDKIEEFAKSEHFDTYRKLFKELGLVQ